MIRLLDEHFWAPVKGFVLWLAVVLGLMCLLNSGSRREESDSDLYIWREGEQNDPAAEALADTPQIGIARRIKPYSGLVRYEQRADSPDWSQAVKEMLAGLNVVR